MQAGRSAMESTKEAAANVGASARAGAEKTRAAVQGTAEKAAARNASDREAVEVRRQERVRAAEEEKQAAVRANAAAKERATAAGAGAGGYHPSQGAPGVAGGGVETGVAESRPIAADTGTARPSAAHNPRVGRDLAQARGIGGQYQ